MRHFDTHTGYTATSNAKQQIHPTFSHPIAVAALIAELGGTEEHVIAALPHDAVEDQGEQPQWEEIRRMFGEGDRRGMHRLRSIQAPAMARAERGVSVAPEARARGRAT